MNYRLFLLFFFSFLVPFKNGWVFSIGEDVFYESDLISFYGAQEWQLASKEKKQGLVEDFIVREAAFVSSVKEGLLSSPSFVQKAYNKKRSLLVNYYYQTEIAKLAIDSSRFNHGKKHLKKDRFVYHILVGHEESSLRAPVLRTKEEALSLCLNIKDTLSFPFFKEAASQFSDDGSVRRNFGKLGWVSWGATVPSFEKAVFDGAFRSFLGPIETSFGFHLAYVDSVRPSSFSLLSDEEFFDALLLRSTSKSVGVFKDLSTKHDSLVLASKGLVFNDSLVVAPFLNSSLGAQHNKNDIVGFLKETKKPGVVCVFGGEALGFDWFIERLSFIPPSSRPTIKDSLSLFSIFKTVLLQDEAYKKAVLLGLDKKGGFLRVFDSYKKDLLYNLYFKSLVNSVPSPDSLDVLSFYNKTKNEKYKKPKSLKLQEVRSLSWAKADSLLGLYINGVLFEDLVKNHSVFINSNKGSIGPVEASYLEGRLSYYFKDFVKEGDVGPIVKNFDNSFSFYLVEKVYPESFIPYEKVYNRASSFVYKEAQNKKKKDKISSFYKELNIVKNDSLL